MAATRDSLSFYVGDIHNHCNISYGIGDLEPALETARSHLDFASVTGHAWWHDLPDAPELEESRRIHQEGFDRLARKWDSVVETVNEYNEEGSFVTYPSFEWHSIRHGDRCVYFRDGSGPLLRSDSLGELREEMRRLRNMGVATMAIPHHPSYGRDNRGLKWDELDEDLEPVVEIISTHGSADLEVDRPYLLAIGPRDFGGSLQEGLLSGRRFGVIGSTDNHAGFPGSYGYGRVGVWARDLSREGIWEAIVARRTVAMTGDRTELMVQTEEHMMGDTVVANAPLELTVKLAASSAVDTIELLRNGTLIEKRPVPSVGITAGGTFRVPLWVGWGRPGSLFDWHLRVEVDGGSIRSVDPHLRGPLHVDPRDNAATDLSRAARWELRDGGVRFEGKTGGNRTPIEDGTQGLTLEIVGSPSTVVSVSLSDFAPRHTQLHDLIRQPVAYHPYGYAGPAIQLGPCHLEGQCEYEGVFVDESPEPGAYQARVRLRNGQWAWSSPLWVGE